MSPFRSLEYARPFRVGDVFLLCYVEQSSDHAKFMASLVGTNHLVLRSSPVTSSYVMALSGTHERFLYDP